MERKGFPESYDRRALLRFVSEVKAGRPEVRVPVYDHLTYDIVPGREIVVQPPRRAHRRGPQRAAAGPADRRRARRTWR